MVHKTMVFWAALIATLPLMVAADEPKDAVEYTVRGFAHHEKGDYDKAIEDYTQAIHLDPKYAVAYYNRGDAYENKRDYAKAIEDLTHAIRLNPAFTDAYTTRAAIYLTRKTDYA